MSEWPKSPIEHVPEIDFLSEKLRVQFSMEREAAQYLPQVAAEDLKTRKEKYRILLGETRLGNQGEVIVHVKGVMEMEGEDHGYYKEGVEAVEEVKVGAIKRMVADTQSENPEYADYNFIGDIHTHPVLAEDFENGLLPHEPSPADIQAVIDCYESGELDPSRPFIFGIASPDDDGETVYMFYRLVKTEDDYKCIEVEV